MRVPASIFTLVLDNFCLDDLAEGFKTDLPVVPSREDRPETSLVRSQEQDSLLRLIHQLAPERQHLLILKFVENLSNAEIGQIMGRSEGAVKSLYHRTLLSLRDELVDQIINLEGD